MRDSVAVCLTIVGEMGRFNYFCSKMIENMTEKQHYSTATEAADRFMQGYNCGQAVFTTFAERYGLTKGQAMRISAAFGGGIGRQRQTCGAVLALSVLAGMEYGNESPEDKARMLESFSAIREMSEAFKAEYGSIVCGEIMGFPGFEKADGPAQYQPIPEYYKAKPCAMKVKLAAEIFERMLEKREATEK